MHPLTVTLDRHLAATGQDVTLRRRIGTTMTYVDLTVRARVKGYRAEHVVGAVKVTDSEFIFSPTQILAAGAAWPGAAGGDRWPKIGDFLVVNSVQRRIEQTQPVVIGGAVVRIEGRILG